MTVRLTGQRCSSTVFGLRGLACWAFVVGLALGTTADIVAQAPPTATAESVSDLYAPLLTGVADPEIEKLLSTGLARGPRVTPSEVEDVMKKWRESTGGPNDGPGWLVAARLWRQAGVPDSAVQGLRRASAAGGLPSGLLSLEASRTGFLAGRPEAAGAYWEACERPAPVVLDELWRDFVALATPAEAEEWAGLDSLSADTRSAAACAMLRRAWAKRAPGRVRL